MNRVMLVGNLGRDPEMKELGDGVHVVRVQLATTEVFRDKQGSLKSNTQWHTILFWRSLADLVAKFLKKGALIYVEGKIQYRKFEDKSGITRYVTEIFASQLLMLDKRTMETSKASDQEPDDALPF